MKVLFHKKIYAEAAIQAAIEAFDGIAKVAVTREGEYFATDVEAVEADAAAEVVAEFKNYVLGETIAMRGVS